MTEQVGHEEHGTPAAHAATVRNAARPKTVLVDAAGEVRIEVPSDRAATCAPVIVTKRQRRLTMSTRSRSHCRHG